jgi:hypothetical protein
MLYPKPSESRDSPRRRVCPPPPGLAGERGDGRVPIPTQRGDIHCGTLNICTLWSSPSLPAGLLGPGSIAEPLLCHLPQDELGLCGAKPVFWTGRSKRYMAASRDGMGWGETLFAESWAGRGLLSDRYFLQVLLAGLVHKTDNARKQFFIYIFLSV